MLVVGETLVEPEVGVTEPMPLSIDALVALLLDHESVVEPPCMIDVGLADREPVGAPDGAVAADHVPDPQQLDVHGVTVAAQIMVPLLFTAWPVRLPLAS